MPKYTWTIVCSITLFATLGTLLRLALVSLHSYVGAPIIAGAYPQAVGCLVLGFLVQWKVRLIRISRPLYIGLSAGFCGSVTTFSGWMLWILDALCGWSLAQYRGAFDNILAAVAVAGTVLLVAFASFNIGSTWATMAARIRWTRVELGANGRSEDRTSAAKTCASCLVTYLDLALVVGGVLAIVSMVACAASVSNGRNYTLAGVFSPMGALLRYHLSSWNTQESRFPIGTFTANMTGTVLLAIFFALSHAGLSLGYVGCLFLAALSDGFCGCLTTLSTLVMELHSLSLLDAHRYAIASVVSGVAILIAIPGVLYWTRGLLSDCG